MSSKVWGLGLGGVSFILVLAGGQAGAAMLSTATKLGSTTTSVKTTSVATKPTTQFSTVGLSTVLVNSTGSSTPITSAPSYSCASTASSCTMYMPLYNQHDRSLGSQWFPTPGKGSMLCAPTSASMILEGQQYYTRATNPAQAGSWTANHFSGRSWQYQVNRMADLVSCSATTGTIILPWVDSYFAGAGVGGRAGDFARSSGETSFFPTGVEGSDIEPKVRARNGVMMLYGRYTRNVNRILGVDYVTFSRDGGHFVAVSGFTRNSSNADHDTFQFNNPSGGVRQWSRIHQILGGSFWEEHSFLGVPYWTLERVVILPVIALQAGFMASTQSGNYFEVFEAHSRLGVGN